MLELVVVLAILAVMTSVSLTFIGENDEKQRYQASLTKLKAVQKNFLNVSHYQGKTVVSGFLVDNGLLYNDSEEPDLGYSVNALLGYQNLPTLMPFSAVQAYVNIHTNEENDEDIHKVIVNESLLFKGVRPGLFDLSEYRDNDSNLVGNVVGSIRDGWGDNFAEDLPAAASVESANLSVAIEPYKNIAGSSRTVHFSVDEYDLPVLNLSVDVLDLPDTTTEFRVALASFNNESGCSDDPENCWHTVKSNIMTGATEPIANTFVLTHSTTPTTTYDDSSLTVEGVTPGFSESLTALSVTDNNGDSWAFSQAGIINSTFTFSGDKKLTPGTHVAVLLCKNTATTTWEVYSPSLGCAVASTEPAADPVFEYLHILPGVMPEPIVIEL